MKHFLRVGYLGFTAISLAMLSARAVEIGQQAPTLKGVRRWLNGDAVEPAQGDGQTRYVVWFWATWCTPCHKTIPQLNALQEKFRDQGVVVVGITTESEETVRPFIGQFRIAYRVGLDLDATTEETWMRDVAGLPHAFIVDVDGRIVWSGHPMEGLAEALTNLIEGRYDVEAARLKQADERALGEALRNGDIRTALEITERMWSRDRTNVELAQLRAILLYQADRQEPLKEHYRQALESFQDSPERLDELAWMQVAPSPLPLAARDLWVAWRAASRAAELTQRKDASVLDTLALVLFQLGFHDEAVATMEEAVKVASAEEERASLERTLAYFRDARRVATEVARAIRSSSQTPSPP